VIEEGVGGKQGKAREIECSVLGNDKPLRRWPARSCLSKSSTITAPSTWWKARSRSSRQIGKAKQKEVQRLAVAAFQAVDCAGMARVDFLMDPRTKKMYVNEINTIPGFTSISMYPKMWAASGIAYPELMDRLIQLGLERHAEKKRNQYSR